MSDQDTAQHAESDWYSDDSATFGDRLADARQAVGLSQRELARRLGVKAKTMELWENDLSEPRANRLSMLAGILNVSLRWLLTGEGEGLSEPVSELPPETDVILKEIRRLHAEIGRAADRIGVLEKQLRRNLQS